MAAASETTKYQPDEIDPEEFALGIGRIREYFKKQNLIESSVQQRRTILAACEDPKTISLFNHGGMIWPLPQTGQMNLELLLLKSPEKTGYSSLSYSYRNEPDPVEGRHNLIFPLAEFEVKATTPNPLQELIDFELGCLKHLGFDTSKAVVMTYRHAAEMLDVDDIDHAAELRLWKEVSPIVFLTHFPEETHPFWNMRINDKDKTVADKVDVILYGQETFGSASRSCNKEEMRRMFETIEDGKYASLLYSAFTKERVSKEMDEYLELDFIPRYGGGIGVTRLLRAMRLAGLLGKE